MRRSRAREPTHAAQGWMQRFGNQGMLVCAKRARFSVRSVTSGLVSSADSLSGRNVNIVSPVRPFPLLRQEFVSLSNATVRGNVLNRTLHRGLKGVSSARIEEDARAEPKVDFEPIREERPVDPPSHEGIPGKTLADYGISNTTQKHLQTCGITSLFPVQQQTFEALMDGKDMVVKSRTGSGKTIAFVLPIVEKILSRPAKGKRYPRSVVLAPTRELAIQIHREFERVGPQVQAVCIYGGASYTPQDNALRRGVDVVVGTPGRTIDHINKGSLDMSRVEIFVLDEADEMLKMGFQNDVETIMSEIPAETRQTNLWSATMPHWVQKLAKEYCKDLQYVDMVGEDPTRTAATIKHIAIACDYHSRAPMIADIVRLHGKSGRALVFANTKADVDALAASPELKATARTIHGDVNQAQREVTLQDFRAGAFTTLIATDVAARGIDVPEVEVVVQTSVPEDEDTFVHRSGRTGRAGRSGVNVVLYKGDEEPELLQLQKEVGIEFVLEGAPKLKEVLEARAQELADTLARVPPRSSARFEQHAASLLEALGDKALPAALAVMAGYGSGAPASYSILQGRRDHVTLHARMEPKLRGRVRGMGQLRDMLERAAHGARISTGRVVLVPTGYLFDVPTKQVHHLLGENWEVDGDAVNGDVSPMPGLTLEVAERLPTVEVLAQAVQQKGQRGGGQRGGGGRFESRGRFNGGGGGGGGWGDNRGGGGRWNDSRGGGRWKDSRGGRDEGRGSSRSGWGQPRERRERW